MAEEKANEIDKFDAGTQVSGSLNANPQLLNGLLWEMCGNLSEVAIPIPLDESTMAENLKSKSEQAIPQMCDIMLAQVLVLGHRDKFPKPYQWEGLLQMLSPNEELLWIVSKEQDAQSFDLYLGIKFNNSNLGDVRELANREERFQILCDDFSRCLFPESKIKRIEPCATADKPSVQSLLNRLCTSRTESRKLDQVFCVTGMPSNKDADVEKVVAERKVEERPFESLNSVLEAHLNVSSPFTVIFSVSPASSEDVTSSFQQKFELRDAIKPMMSREVSKTESKTVGSGLNVTLAHRQVSESGTRKRGIPYTFCSLFVGNRKGFQKFAQNSIVSDTRLLLGMSAQQKSQPSATGKLAEVKRVLGIDDASADNVSISVSPDVHAKSSHEDQTRGVSQTIHLSRSDLIYVDKHLEKSLLHLQQSLSGGGYYATAMVYTDKCEVGESVSRSIRAALTGSHSYLRPMQIFNVESEDFFQLKYNLPVSHILSEFVHYEVLNCQSACLALMLPDADLPGNPRLKRSVFYARPKSALKPQPDQDMKYVNLGKVAYFENQLQFKSDKNNTARDFLMPKKELFSHLFVVGSPGGGKSYRTRHILNAIPLDIRLLVLETAKREYGDWMHREGKRLIRYTLGNSRVFPLRINPFYFDPGTSLKQHIAVLADAISDLLPMEALIGPKLREAIENCYYKCGWDIETGAPIDPDAVVSPYPDMLMFNVEVAHICEKLTDYGPEVRSNYTGALKNRSALFLDDVYQDIFSYDGNRSIDELLPPDADVVVEMEDMPPSEINMPAFIISILLQRLRAYRFQRHAQYLAGLKQGEQGEEQDRFFIAIEEAHNVLSRKIEQGKGDETQSGKGAHLLNQVCRLLAEGRGVGLGIMVIDQSAHAIAPSVLADTNTKVIFRVENGDELKTIGTSIGLEKRNWPDMQMLDEGECIIKNGASYLPTKLSRLDDEPQRMTPCEQSACLITPITYAQCQRRLDDLFSGGVISWSRATRFAREFVEDCDWRRSEFIRYVWGRYLMMRRQEALVEAHLDATRDLHFEEDLVAYYTRKFFAYAQEDAVSDFITLLETEDTKKAAEDATANARIGADKFLSVLSEDVPEADKDWVQKYHVRFFQLPDDPESLKSQVSLVMDFRKELQDRKESLSAYRRFCSR